MAASAMERLRQAVIEKAKAEAEKIIREAEERARSIIEDAKRRKAREIEEARKHIKDEIEYDVRIAEAKIKTRYFIAQAKNEIYEKLRESVLRELRALGEDMRRESIRNIMREIIESGLFEGQKIRVYVAERDRGIARRAIQELGIGDLVVEIAVAEGITGGVIVENLDKTVKVDASYERRLETILRSRVAEINQQLFGE